MKFSCEKAQLLSAITVTAKVASAKSAVPALEGLLLEAGDDTLRVSGYDLKTGIRTEIPAEVREPGKIVLNAKLLGEIIRKLPDDIVSVSLGENHLATITCGQSKSDITGLPAADYPDLPTVEAEHTFSLPQNTLKSMIAETIFAVSDNESQPIHTGSLFEIEGETLTIISVDGFRLALRREQLEKAKLTDCSFVVPGSALNEVEKIASDTEDLVTLSLGTKHILFSLGDTIVISRRLEGSFLNYKQVIPQNNKINLLVDKRALTDSVERVSIFINEKLKSPVRCVFGDGKIQLFTATVQGQGYDECPMAGDGKNLEIGFNNKYLLDALKVAPASAVSVSLGTSVSPCVIGPSDAADTSFTYLVLPVRLKAGE
ncbi:MAG: DNA polymerase III subunit beta [Oscillospiraceae bacterium]|nr:DNA polymerase III subunit beta [Oscillospiraceae bacterium]